jgi:hypothetical protein
MTVVVSAVVVFVVDRIAGDDAHTGSADSGCGPCTGVAEKYGFAGESVVAAVRSRAARPVDRGNLESLAVCRAIVHSPVGDCVIRVGIRVR